MGRLNDEIKLLKDEDENKLSDFELVQKFYEYLTDELKFTKKKAFSIIYYLQEHLPVFPDNIEKCTNCGRLYDTWKEGHHSELTEGYYCSENCEPYNLHEREQRAEKKGKI